VRLQFKFNPALKRDLGSSRRIWMLRSISLRIEQHTNPLWSFEIYHRRLLLALGGLALAGYLLAVTGLYAWLNRQPHNQVGWFDLAAPWHWSGLRAKRGDGAVQAGLDALRERNYSDAFYQLRVGLARSPGNVEGRLALAQLYAGYDPTRALALIEDGLIHPPANEKLVAALLEFYAMLQVRERALVRVDELLRQGVTGRARILLERARVGLLIEMGRLAEAEQALAAVPAPAEASDRRGLAVLRLELLLRAGRLPDARAQAEALLTESDLESNVLRQCGEVAISLGDAGMVQSVLRRMQAREPEVPGPYLYAIQAWHQLKRLTLREGAERDYFNLFRSNDGALQAVAALGVNLDQPDLVNRARQVAASARLSQFAYRVHLTEIFLRRGNADQAMRSLRDWETEIETLKPAQRFYPEFIRRLARAAFAGTPDQITALQSHLAANRFQARLQVYDLAATVLDKAKHPAAAVQLARAGLQLYPDSAPLVAANQRLEQELAASAATSAPALASVPSGELPAGGPQALEQLDRQLADDELAAARDLLRAIRAQKPVWLTHFEGELAVRDVELAFLALDPLSARGATRTYLDRYRGEADARRLVGLARRFAERGRTAEARLLQDEIAASSGATAAVRQALGELALPDEAAMQTATQESALAALDRFIAAADWVQAERLLRQLGDRPPAWMNTGATEVKAREVLVRFGLDQRPLALAAFKDLVVKGGVARGAAFRLVRDLLAREETDTALLLAREVQKLMPGDPAAARLLKEAEAPRPAE